MPTVRPSTMPLHTADYPKAPSGARVVAYFIDSMIAVAGLLPALLLYVTVGEGQPERMAIVPVFLIGFCWMMWYAYTKDGWHGGASIGKRRVGLMVLHLASGLPCSKGRSVGRACIGYSIGSLPCFGFLVEPAMVLVRADGRRFADRVLGTQVIRTDDYVAP